MPTDSQRLARSVIRLGRRLRQERQTDLTATQLSVLGSVHLLDDATPSQIAAREMVSQPSVTRTLNCLLERGLIEKSAHPVDGRQVVITVSDLGEKVLADERHRRDVWLEDRLSQLAPQDRATLDRAIDLLMQIAESET